MPCWVSVCICLGGQPSHCSMHSYILGYRQLHVVWNIFATYLLLVCHVFHFRKSNATLSAKLCSGRATVYKCSGTRDANSRYFYEFVTTRYSGYRYSLLGIRYSNRYWLLPYLVQRDTLSPVSAYCRLMPVHRGGGGLASTAWQSSPDSRV